MNDNQKICTVPGHPMTVQEILAQQRVVSGIATLMESVDPSEIDEWEREAGHERS